MKFNLLTTILSKPEHTESGYRYNIQLASSANVSGSGGYNSFINCGEFVINSNNVLSFRIKML